MTEPLTDERSAICLHGGLRRSCEPCDLADRLEAVEVQRNQWIACSQQVGKDLAEAYIKIRSLRFEVARLKALVEELKACNYGEIVTREAQAERDWIIERDTSRSYKEGGDLS